MENKEDIISKVSGGIKPTDVLPSINGIPIPNNVKKNAILALVRGIGNLITSIIDIPTAYFEGISQSIRAKTEGKITVSKAAAEIASHMFKRDNKLAERALEYFGENIIKEQKNRESVARKTIEELGNDKITTDADCEIDNDWLTIFWKLAETKSNEEVQQLLARILVGEIRKPKSVSPHTLQLLSVLTGDLAHSFEKLCNLSIDDGESVFVLHPHVFPFQNIGPLFDYGISYDDLFELDGIGLIRSAETLMVNYERNENSKLEKVDYAGLPALLNLSGTQVHLIQFTKSGKELRRLIAHQRNEKYTKALEKKLGSEHFKANIAKGI